MPHIPPKNAAAGGGRGGCGGGDVMSKSVQKVIFWANVTLKNAFWEQNTCLKSRKVHNYIENVFFPCHTYRRIYAGAGGGCVGCVHPPKMYFGSFWCFFRAFLCILVRSRAVSWDWPNAPPRHIWRIPGLRGACDIALAGLAHWGAALGLVWALSFWGVRSRY